VSESIRGSVRDREGEREGEKQRGIDTEREK
jgi:hypothetical protein